MFSLLALVGFLVSMQMPDRAALPTTPGRLVAGTIQTARAQASGTAPARRAPTRPPAPSASPAQVRTQVKVTVPKPDAALGVEGQVVSGSGYYRQFALPPLENGKTYEYTFVTLWSPNNYTVITRRKKVSSSSSAIAIGCRSWRRA